MKADAGLTGLLANLFAKMDERFTQIEKLIRQKQTVKDFYTTKELAEILGRQEYTVREWCRLKRLNAKKLEGGRGNEGEWRISHDELIRYQRGGLLPLSAHAAYRY